jgi:predicted nucleic acid-binding protein
VARTGGKAPQVKVLFDANVVLDVLLKRPGFGESALALAKVPEPWITALSVANICYIVGRSKRARIAASLDFLRKKFHIAAVADSTIERAIRLNYDDFEDALQVAAAKENGVRHLVTRNLPDFQSSRRVQILSVPDLLAKLEP